VVNNMGIEKKELTRKKDKENTNHLLVLVKLVFSLSLDGSDDG
jgi:hypothetical protein